MKERDKNGDTKTTSQPDTSTAQPYRALVLDTDHYQRMLERPDLTDTQRREIIQALWVIICTFVDLGYQIASEESCGQEAEQPALTSDAVRDLLKSPANTITNTFETSATTAAKKEAS